jgi:tetratricopeptide (TPR) repeat protein
MRIDKTGYILNILLLACGTVLTLNSEKNLKDYTAKATNITNDKSREILYLPSGSGLDILSFGYKNALAHYLWFSTISYFGKHYQGDRNFEWLFHRCKLITSLNPKALHVYEFGSTMLSWEQKQPDQAILLLSDAIKQFPQDWRLYYLRGFTYSFFLKDEERARVDLVTASKLPNVHPIIASLAAKKVSSLNNPETAIVILKGLIASATDKQVREALQRRLKEIQT